MYRLLAICGTIKLLLISSSLICNNSLLSFLTSIWAIVTLPSLRASLVAQHGKEFACNVGNPGSIPGSWRSPGGGHGNPLQYSCLENSQRQRSLAGYSAWRRKESDATEWLSIAEHHREKKIYFPTKICTWVFIAALFVILKNWQSRCHTVSE